MQSANKEYFFIRKEAKDDLPSLTPNEDTSWRLRRSRQSPDSDAPYIFMNGAIDYQKAKSIKPLNELPEVMVGTNEFYFSNQKFNFFEKLDLPGMVAQPCIYIDHNDAWHEDLWHVSVIKKIDCWSRELSDYDEGSGEKTKDGIVYDVDRYSLSDEILDKIPLSERLLFKIGGVQFGGVLIHNSLINFFTCYGVRFIPVEEYSL